MDDAAGARIEAKLDEVLGILRARRRPGKVPTPKTLEWLVYFIRSHGGEIGRQDVLRGSRVTADALDQIVGEGLTKGMIIQRVVETLGRYRRLYKLP